MSNIAFKLSQRRHGRRVILLAAAVAALTLASAWAFSEVAALFAPVTASASAVGSGYQETETLLQSSVSDTELHFATLERNHPGHAAQLRRIEQRYATRSVRLNARYGAQARRFTGEPGVGPTLALAPLMTVKLTNDADALNRATVRKQLWLDLSTTNDADRLLGIRVRMGASAFLKGLYATT